MSESLASFRDLKGIGAATEARLHEAGIYSWEALAAAATALAAVREEGDTLRDVAVSVARRGNGAGGDEAPRLPGAEQQESFVLRLALGSDGATLRCTMTHVRTLTERVWPGWEPEQVAAFVTEAAQVRTGVPAPPAPAAPLPAPVPPAPPAAPAAVRRTATTEHVVVLDAGKRIGRGHHDVDLQVTGTRAAGGAFGYHAELQTRRLGARGDAGWTTIATSSGTGDPPADLSLRYPDVQLLRGIHRLRLRLGLRLATPARRAPALELAGRAEARVS